MGAVSIEKPSYHERHIFIMEIPMHIPWNMVFMLNRGPNVNIVAAEHTEWLSAPGVN